MRYLLVLIFLFCTMPSKACKETELFPININNATEKQLLRLPGIGPKKAQRILKYRKIKKFLHPVEIIRIKGIGKKRYYRIKKLIKVK